MEQLTSGLIMAAQVLLSLSILVGLHEFGHLIAAKIFGMRVEKFSIGFPPKIFGFQHGETEYSLGAIPLGGFVKISGMVDESMDTEYQGQEPQSWEYRSKPAWQRLIVMLGGIFANIITGILIFVIMTYSLGESYISKEELNKHGIVAYQLGQELGLQTGDRILKVNGHEYQKFSDLKGPEVLLGDNSYYTVQRGEETLKVFIPGDFIEKFADEGAADRFFEPRFPFEIVDIMKGSGAEKVGLERGDEIVKLNDQPIQYFYQLKGYLAQYDQATLNLEILRKGQLFTLNNLELGENNTLGIYHRPLLEISYTNYSFMESIPKGTGIAFGIIGTQIKAFSKMFSGELNPVKSLSGPIGIARSFGDTWDWTRFWRMTGLLSMVLAFMNFLPIPALDGGHVVFLSFEILSGHRPSDNFLENAQKVGLVLLLCLMAFAFGNDIFKIIF